jgi:hypothetical protein
MDHYWKLIVSKNISCNFMWHKWVFKSKERRNFKWKNPLVQLTIWKTIWCNPLYLATDMNLHHLCSHNVSNKIDTWNSAWFSIRWFVVKFTMASFHASKVVQISSKDFAVIGQSSSTFFSNLVLIPNNCLAPMIQSKKNLILPTQLKQKRILHSSIGYFYINYHYNLWHCSLP